MGDIVGVYTIKGEISGAPVTKIVYVMNGSLDALCAEEVRYSDGSDGTGRVEVA